MDSKPPLSFDAVAMSNIDIALKLLEGRAQEFLSASKRAPEFHVAAGLAREYTEIGDSVRMIRNEIARAEFEQQREA